MRRRQVEEGKRGKWDVDDGDGADGDDDNQKEEEVAVVEKR